MKAHPAIVTSAWTGAFAQCQRARETVIEARRKSAADKTVRKPQHIDVESSNRHRDATRASLGIPTLSASTQTLDRMGIADAEIDEACLSEQIE
jgi:hypothetical protein